MKSQTEIERLRAKTTLGPLFQCSPFIFNSDYQRKIHEHCNDLMGSSYFPQSPFHCPSSSSSSSSHSQSSVFLYARNAESTRRNRVSTMASMRPEEPNESVFSKSRAVLLVGISILPLLKLRAIALEGVASKESELDTAVGSQKAEGLQGESLSNPLLCLLNVLGIFGTGVLAALYALTQNDKKATDETIESMKSELKEKEATIFSLGKEFESKLLNEQEEKTRQLKMAKEEQQSLMNQLNAANSTIVGLGQELKNEKKMIDELKAEIENLQTNVLKAGEDRTAVEEKLKEKLDSIAVLQDRIKFSGLELRDKDDNVQNLSCSLVERESELKSLNFTYKQTTDELAKADSEIQVLRDELQKCKMELESKISKVNELDAGVGSLIVERDASKRKIAAVQKEYNDLKLSSEKKAASDAKLLVEREELHWLKEKLEVVLNEATENRAIIAKLTQEKEELRKMLDGESSNVKNLKHELQITMETLGKTRNEASDLAKQLQQSKNLCAELEPEMSRVQAEFAEVRETLQNSLDEAKRSGEVLASELTAAQELLKNTNEELQIASHELAATEENRDSLQRELVNVYKKAEAAANDLQEEKKVVSSLNKELQALEKQVSKGKELRKALEKDLEEATKSLDEMNRNALTLSRNLEKGNSQISSLEYEKEVLYKSLTKQKNIAKVACENMEDAHTIVMRLGKERESLDKKAKKLEEEVAAAKAEILRLRSQVNSSKTLVNDQNLQKSEDEDNVTVTAKRSGRRRKSSSQ